MSLQLLYISKAVSLNNQKPKRFFPIYIQVDYSIHLYLKQFSSPVHCKIKKGRESPLHKLV